ncbi:MAG: hypothetical protein WDO68_26845 [Gammaproteobacteria bacterium]
MIIAAAMILVAAHFFERPVAQSLVPVFSSALERVGTQFKILEIGLHRDGRSNDVIRLRANLAHPIAVTNGTAQPFEGWYEISITLGSVFSYGLLCLILAIAWPFVGAKQLFFRLIIALPLTALLLVGNVCLTFLAELWNLIRQDFDPGAPSLLLRWSRFAMGGGGFAAAIVLSAIAILATTNDANVPVTYHAAK